LNLPAETSDRRYAGQRHGFDISIHIRWTSR
jgi:hypothetical protein